MTGQPKASLNDLDRPNKEAFPVDRIREDFPILARKIRDKDLVYLDNASSTQKPSRVIRALTDYYERYNSNVHRGVHTLSQEATAAFERVRGVVKRYLGAGPGYEVVFTRGTTEAINLVAQSWGRAFLSPGDEILVSEMEHHSNIVPWQEICREVSANLRVLPVSDEGELILEQLDRLIGPRTKLVAVTHMSNALGTINPVERICEAAHGVGAKVLIDGAQAAPHLPVDLDCLDADFYAFSGHKVYAPTGTGALVAKREILDAMPPWQGGGDMIKSVSFERTVYNDLPYRFEAGTPHIGGIIAMGEALEYVAEIGLQEVAMYELGLVLYATEKLRDIEGLRIFGNALCKAGVISFIMDSAHPHDIGTILDMQGVAIRTGHHCAEPLMRRFGVPATARASFAIYNTREEIDVLAQALQEVNKVFG